MDVLFERRKELEILLEQAEGYFHSLSGDLEILESEVFDLCDEVGRAHEVKVRDDFSLCLLKLERDSARAELSCARRDFKSKGGFLNVGLLALTGELNSICQELAHS